MTANEQNTRVEVVHRCFPEGVDFSSLFNADIYMHYKFYNTMLTH